MLFKPKFEKYQYGLFLMGLWPMLFLKILIQDDFNGLGVEFSNRPILIWADFNWASGAWYWKILTWAEFYQASGPCFFGNINIGCFTGLETHFFKI